MPAGLVGPHHWPQLSGLLKDQTSHQLWWWGVLVEDFLVQVGSGSRRLVQIGSGASRVLIHIGSGASRFWCK